MKKFILLVFVLAILAGAVWFVFLKSPTQGSAPENINPYEEAYTNPFE